MALANGSWLGVIGRKTGGQRVAARLFPDTYLSNDPNFSADSEQSPDFACPDNGFGAVHVDPWQIVEARFRFLEKGEEFQVSGILPVAEVGAHYAQIMGV